MHKPHNESPGPHANYIIKNGFGGLVGANRYSFTGKQRYIASTYGGATPAPNAYTPMKTSLGGQKYTFGARPVELPGGNHVPGPGKYNVDESYNKQKRKLAYSLTGRPVPLSGSEHPGPGQYSVQEAYAKSHVTGPSYSFVGKNRRVDLSDTVPGPAAYSYSPKKSGSSFTFKGKYIQPGSHEIVPGPGAYSHELKNGGAQFSLAKRFPQHDTTFAYTELAKQMMLKG